MIGTHIEREVKYDVETTFIVPDLASLLPRGAGVEVRTERLRSSYFDTAQHDLLQAEMTLRRRTGTTDSGWQLKVAHAPAAREEISLPPQGNTVPKELRLLLAGVTRGQRLRQVARLATERTAHRLLDADGNLLAEIADDTVDASVGGGAAATILRWREVEIELGNGDEKLLATLGKRLCKAGARPSTSRSKLARVLLPPTPAGPGAGGGSRAAAPVLDYLAEQQRMLLAGDLALRRGQDEVTHKTRVATRRFRSTLRTFGPLFDEERAAELDSELKWFAGLLGEVRDRQVQRVRLDRLIDRLPDEIVLGPVRARINTQLGKEQAGAWKRLSAELVGQRYRALLDALAAWVSDPPLTDKAQASVSVLSKMVGKAERVVSRRLARATASRDVDLLHAARKAAKRARYAAELTEPVTDTKAARKLAGRYERLQDLLGEHQDSLVSADILRRLGAKAGTTPHENGFTFGLLYQQVLHEAESLREQAHGEAASRG